VKWERERERGYHIYSFFSFFLFQHTFLYFSFPLHLGSHSFSFWFSPLFMVWVKLYLYPSLFFIHSYLLQYSTLFLLFFSIIILLSFSYLESGPKLCIPFFFFFFKICLKIGVKNELRQLPSLYNTYGINTLKINICLTLYSKFVKKRKITKEKKVFFFGRTSKWKTKVIMSNDIKA
jgi:hypothetical protein